MDRRQKPRSMTFTGCWTCKSRKVKCDEGQPECGNCTRIGAVCGGYGVRLQWISDPFSQDGPANSQVKGRIRIARDHGPGYSATEIEDFLCSIESATADSGQDIRRGPFSTFPARTRLYEGPATKASSASLLSGRNTFCQDSGSNCRYEELMSITEGHGDTSTQSSRGSVEPDLQLSISAASESVLSAGTGTDNHISRQPQERYTISDGDLLTKLPEACLGTPSDANTVDQSSLVMTRISASVSGDSFIDNLMHHYIVHMSDLLQPISHPRNPYRTLYVPAALEVASDLTFHQSLDRNVKSVLYHSLIASSAFHLWNCNPERAEYKRAGSQHRQAALHLLSSVIGVSTPSTEYKTLLMAMLSLVTIGWSGGEADFAVHLNGTAQLRKSRRSWRIVSSATRQLNDISIFLSILAKTTTFKPSLVPWSGEDSLSLDDDIAISAGSGSCLEYMYGITPSIAAAIQETCRLAEYLSWYEADTASIPESLLEACEALGDRLLSWSLELEEVTTIPNNDAEMKSIFDHHARAWHIAAMIYYCRRIQNCRIADLEKETARVAEHMHAVEDIKAQSKSDRASRMAPMTWPAFVASMDATDREPWRRWWERVKLYRIANIQRQWETIQNIWQRRDEMEWAGINPPSWVEIFVSYQYNLLPI